MKGSRAGEIVQTEDSKTLIKSISGIRGIVGSGLDPLLVVRYAAGLGSMLPRGQIVVGRDSRPSGEMLRNAVLSGLASVGRDVVDIGIVPTPTVGLAVKQSGAAGGICITASHNPAQWNALKFFNGRGEFITLQQYNKLDNIVSNEDFSFKPHTRLGDITEDAGWIEKHVRQVLDQKPVNRVAIKRRRFKVVVDAVNGAGSRALPLILERLGVETIGINCDQSGNFTRGTEPVAENLRQLSKAVVKHKADLGMACDPDADRLALVDELGVPIGEELTLTIAVMHVLSKIKGPTVINLSTSLATADVARQAGSPLFYSKVGESNVVQMMRARRAVIGGEGNGGVIFPASHAGRDTLTGVALVLTCLAQRNMELSQLVGTLPKYYNIKIKVPLPNDFRRKLVQFEKRTKSLLGKTRIDRRDGLRFDFKRGWLLIRASNTEPIFRLVVETDSADNTKALVKKALSLLK